MGASLGRFTLNQHQKPPRLDDFFVYLAQNSDQGMLSTSELIALLEDLESDRVERTTSVNIADKFCQAICAFSNDFPGHNNPGYLIIGANDRGDLNGLTITDRLLTNLADIRSSGNILPLPALTIQKYSFPEGELAVVEVFPSDIPPVRYKGRVYIRTGPSKSIASETEGLF